MMLDNWLEAFLGGKAIESGAPSFDGLGHAWGEILRAYRSQMCVKLRPRGNVYAAGNSIVVCAPQILGAALLPGNANLRIGFNIVRIHGSLDEDLHFHTSHVFTYVVTGEGWLDHLPGDVQGESQRIHATPGDLLVIPQGVRHLFNCAEGQTLLTMGVEVSDTDLNYQKNFYQDL